MATMEAWAFAFGILGNIISFLVGLAPLPTFYQIYKKKTAEGFQSVPYVVALFSAMLWIYYAIVKSHDSILLITINSFCCVIETAYIAIYLYYAPKKDRITTVKLFLSINVFGFGTICLLTIFLAQGQSRLTVLGYICMAFALSVFAAPLCIVRKVIKTKSVEFMPFSLSFCLTLNAVAWFFYGLFLKDWNIAVPNTLGFIFGVLQMVLYMFYRNATKVVEEQKMNQELQEHIVDVMKLSAIVCTDLNAVVVPELNNNNNTGNDHHHHQVIHEDQSHVKEHITEEAKQNEDEAPNKV